MSVEMTYVLVVALFAGLPEIIDILLAYRAQNKTRNLLIQKASVDKLTMTELREFLSENAKAPPGISNLTRGMIALTVIVILGIAVFHLLANPPAGGESQTVNNVLSMLGGLLAAITGFYFGGKAAEPKGEQKPEIGTEGGK